MSLKKILPGLLRGGLKTALPLLALFVGVTSFISLKSNRPAPPKPVRQEVVQPVRTLEIEVTSHQPRLRLYGEIKSGRKVELRALVAGKVLKTGAAYREGALVKKGEPLLSIDPFNYEGAVVEARAKIIEAKARLKEIKAQISAETDSIKHARQQLVLSKRDLDRAQKLVRRGSVTRQGADQRELVVSQRRQTIDGKTANLGVLRARSEQQVAGIESLEWRLQQARRNRADTQLKAPFSGYITDLNADMGRLLNVNDKVALLIDKDWMDVVFTLSDRQYGRLLKGGNDLIGRLVNLTWKLGETPLQYKAAVERVGAQILSETGGVRVYARLKNPSSPRPIRTGAFVDVELSDRLYDKVVRLPQTSLYGRSRVYVVGPKNRLQERRVILQAIDDEFVLVSGDLASGDRVVVTRMSTIGAGMKVLDLRDAEKSSNKPERPGSLSNNDKTLRDTGWQPTSAKGPGGKAPSAMQKPSGRGLHRGKGLQKGKGPQQHKKKGLGLNAQKRQSRG